MVRGVKLMDSAAFQGKCTAATAAEEDHAMRLLFFLFSFVLVLSFHTRIGSAGKVA